MAVRNLEAIKQQCAMIAGQQANKRRMIEENFWKRVNIIQESHNDAIDFVDTVNAMRKNGMRKMVEDWLRNKNVHYTFYDEKFEVCCFSDKKQSASVYYDAKENSVDFGWSGYGMCEYYSTREDASYIINRSTDTNRHYDEGLTMMAERLQPFLDAFFKWVETI